MNYSRPRGTNDILPIENRQRYELEKKLRNIAVTYNYQEIRTPIFELAELFKRTVGNESDIVSKEMFEFSDGSGRKLALRPENTAPITRAVLQENLINNLGLPLKLFYYGEMFRYERPQKGRRRQFTQFGVEVFGQKSIFLDAEVILLALDILKKLQITDTILKINFLGSKSTQNNYQEKLKQFLTNISNTLCKDCQKRIKKNALRVLDCKIDTFIPNLPVINEFWTPEEKKYFADLSKLLKTLEIQYEVDYALVRGLDYYNDLVFEIINLQQLQEGQGTLIGGGRYDSLINQLESVKQMPAIGFAIGIERLLLTLEGTKNNILEIEKPALDAFIVFLTPESQELATKILKDLRNSEISSDMDYEQRNLKGQFNLASRFNCKFIIIIGQNEIDNGNLTIKNQVSGTELKIGQEQLLNYLNTEIKEIKNA